MKENKKKGYLLIENITALALMLLVSSLITMTLIYLVRFNNEYIKYNKERFLVDEFIRFIDVRIKENEIKSFNVQNNQIVLIRNDVSSDLVYDKSVIRKKEDKIIIEYFIKYDGSDRLLTSKLLLENVEFINFSVKNKLLYIEIKTKGGIESLKGISII